MRQSEPSSSAEPAAAAAATLEPQATSGPETDFYERVALAAGAGLAGHARRTEPTPQAEPALEVEPAPEVEPARAATERPPASPPAAPAHLEPALKAAAAAREAAARVRARPATGAAPDGRRLWLVWSSSTGASLEQVRGLRDRPFRPRRQVVGPLPYVTTSLRGPAPVRTPHLTVPPYTVDRLEIGADLTVEPSKPGPGERFSRFRAQVESTSERRLDEDGPAYQAGLPATIPPEGQDPPSLWRRLFRLFGFG